MSEKSEINHDILKQELCSAELVFVWNKKLFAAFGVNPLQFNSLLYLFWLFYSIMHFILSCAALPQNLHNLNNMIDAITEVGSMITILAKLALYRINRKSLADLLVEIEKDYSIDKYENELEVRMFIDYVFKAKGFFQATIPLSIASAVMYFFRPFAMNGFDSANLTTFVLPYRMIFFYPITKLSGYLGALFYLIPVIPITAFGLVTDANLMLAIVAHICGQLSVLSRSLLHFAKDGTSFQQKLSKTVRQHQRLIRMAKTLDSVFNLLMLQQVLSVTFVICFVSYSMLINWSQRESALILTFLVCMVSLSFLLFAYCYAGQCLIDESTFLGNALYTSTWYKLEPSNVKNYIIFMKRTQKPLVITGGRFYIYSLPSFLAVMKSAMAYLSVLRTLI
ncbi:hypothetical protein TSAR_013833 [Trichomalopsis sarcophagae]|uniref:Odorant receptor n=1 Tax=Trichomalopsis sarcophagae TaxID=543379 RepID=A0A232F919_9HYME|nr:hypothetical protein TSAR_013833 [Trichomalopsis sarcophagae]